MKLVNVNYSNDGRKALVYFIAENRLDLRDLVRDLANTLRVRIEVKQIGAREETKVTGGIGPCGRELCCSSWLRDFEAVTVKMAREQGLALNPSRLAGMCGRLKCCLRYEYATYVELKRNLPPVGQQVLCVKGDGKVVRHNILKQTVLIQRDGRRRCRRSDARGPGRSAPAVTDRQCRSLSLSASPASGRGRREPGEGVCYHPRLKVQKHSTLMPEQIHITTSIIYCNAPPHVGALTRRSRPTPSRAHWRRKLGRDHVTFVTGTDEHGQKNQRAAAARGWSRRRSWTRSPRSSATHGRSSTSATTIFVRTTDPVHEKFVQRMLSAPTATATSVSKTTRDSTASDASAFIPKKSCIAGEICPVHNTPARDDQEAQLFPQARKVPPANSRRIIERNPDFIRPERYRNEALNMLAEPLADLCISRPKSRLEWGIELPFDSNYVTYVWYDAFWAYLSELPQPTDDSLSAILPVTEHFIGKDILKTHAVYWPAMLLRRGCRCIAI